MRIYNLLKYIMFMMINYIFKLKKLKKANKKSLNKKVCWQISQNSSLTCWRLGIEWAHFKHYAIIFGRRGLSVLVTCVEADFCALGPTCIVRQNASNLPFHPYSIVVSIVSLECKYPLLFRSMSGKKVMFA